MSDTIVKYIDNSGEKGKIVLSDQTIAAAAIDTFYDNKSYCGFYQHIDQTKTAMTTKATPDATAADFNDKDVKCILTFINNADGGKPKRLAIPAPKCDVADGIATVKVMGKKTVPAVKAVGALGDDGNTMATQAETMLGLTAGDLVFSSASFVKPAS